MATRGPAPGVARWVSDTTDERFAGVRRVEVELAAGRVELGSRNRPDVRARLTLAVVGWRARLARLRPPRLPSVVVDGDVLRVVCRRRSRKVRLQLDLPDDVTVDVAVGEGDITSWGAGGRFRLAVGQGAVVGRDLRTPQVSATCGKGEINLHFVVVPEQVEAETTSGPCVVVVPRGAAYAVRGQPRELTVDVDDAARARISVVGDARTAVLGDRGSERI